MVPRFISRPFACEGAGFLFFYKKAQEGPLAHDAQIQSIEEGDIMREQLEKIKLRPLTKIEASDALEKLNEYPRRNTLEKGRAEPAF